MKKFISTFSKILLLLVFLFTSYTVISQRFVESAKREEIIEGYFDIERKNTTDISELLLNMEGVLLIPSVDIKVPVFTGTSEAAISTGAGIIEGSGSLEDKENVNVIVTSHNGSNNSTLFINLDKLDNGDIFYIKTKEGVEKYEVFDTKTVSPINELEHFIEPQKGEKYITLRTCTPVYINSHRLLVTGKQLPYDMNETIPSQKLVFSSFEYIMMAIGGVSLVTFILMVILDKKEKKSEE
ncbi:class C sortase [uncultured Helcococcus sp.]|uniref:class C sortase n=1 Tax=uncultured Helcococcus sp. TaxID=1072508 RepID=UPI00260A2EF5|nr:class C sortase [uncultured Helcococcus sp.]